MPDYTGNTLWYTGQPKTPTPPLATTGTGGYRGIEAYPGYGVIQSQLRGEIAPDVKAQMQQAAAERGIATGLPGAPITNAAYLRGVGLTSTQLQQQGVANLSPLWQQQVSEEGQMARARLSAGTQLEVAQLEQAGMDSRQATALGAEMERLRFSNNAQDQRQAQELSAAMERLKLGQASDMDRAKLQAATQTKIAEMGEKGAMERLQVQTTAQAEQAELDRVLKRYGVNLEALTNLYSVGVTHPAGVAQYNFAAANPPQKTEWDWATQKNTPVAGGGNLYNMPSAQDIQYYMNPGQGG